MLHVSCLAVTEGTRKKLRLAQAQIAAAEDGFEDDICSDQDVVSLKWLETAHATEWGGHVILEPDENFYFHGKINSFVVVEFFI